MLNTNLTGQMKDIPDKFTREGIDYTLIMRHGNVAAIYEGTRNGFVREYEVWKLRVHKKDNPSYGITAGDIHKPSTKEWGRYGWTYGSMLSANNKFGQLINETTKTQLIDSHELSD